MRLAWFGGLASGDQSKEGSSSLPFLPLATDCGGKEDNE